jgi:hypothetical protein
MFFVPFARPVVSQRSEANAKMNDRAGRQKPEKKLWVRSEPVKAMFTPVEYADLETIADGWGVPIATALWAIVASELSRLRRRTPEYGQHGIAIAAAVTVLRLKELGAQSGITAVTSVECDRSD